MIKQHPDFPDYDVHSNGKVFSHKTKKFLKPAKNKSGYFFVALRNEKRKSVQLHRLVAELFLVRKKGMNSIVHKDGNKENNSCENLLWKLDNSEHPLYPVFHGMRQRCNYDKHKDFHNYGGRGIKVCERWNDFWNFVSDMGERPEGMTLDRIDNDGNYEPSNCRWATHEEQASNRSNNVRVIYKNKKTTIKKLANDFGINESTLRSRLLKGFSLDESLNANFVISKNMYEYKGQKKTLAEYSRQYNISYPALCTRISSYGWSVARAIETPIRKSKNEQN